MRWGNATTRKTMFTVLKEAVSISQSQTAMARSQVARAKLVRIFKTWRGFKFYNRKLL